MQNGLLKWEMLDHLEVLKPSGIGNNFSTEVDKEETWKQNIKNRLYLPVTITSVSGPEHFLPNYT